MSFKEDFLSEWAKSGGLITEATAAKIKGVDRSAISRSNEIKKYRVEKAVFVSLKEVLENETIKPRASRNLARNLPNITESK